MSKIGRCGRCGVEAPLSTWGVWGLCESCLEYVVENPPLTPGELLKRGYDDDDDDVG